MNNGIDNEKFEKITKEYESRKKLPQSIKKNRRIVTIINIIIMIVAIGYLIFLYIGEENIETDSYLKILRILSIIWVCFTVIMLEVSYRKNKNSIILHSIEILGISMFTLYSISAYEIYFGEFNKYIGIAIGFCTIYYLIKIFIIRRNIKKNYYKSLSDMKTIYRSTNNKR